MIAMISAVAVFCAPLSGCAGTGDVTEDDMPSEETAAERAASAQAGNWTDASIKENALSAKCPDEKDDYYFAVNYDWLRETDIKDGHSYESPMLAAEQNTRQKAMGLFSGEEINSHDAELIRYLYETVTDWERRNELGVTPVKKTVSDISGIGTMEELTAFICDPARSNCVDTFVSAANVPGLNDPAKYTVRIGNDRLLLEDAAEYAVLTETGNRIYEAKKELFTTLAVRLGLDEEGAGAIYDSVLALEEQIASVSMSAADKLSDDRFLKMNNDYTPDELASVAGDFPVIPFVNGFGYGKAEIFSVNEPDVLRKLNELYKPENLAAIKNYMLVHYLIYMSDKLDRECYEAYVRTQNTLSGAAGYVSDEEMAYEAVLKFLRVPLEKTYLEKYDCSGMKEDITRLCGEIIPGYKAMIESEDWLSEEMKQRAVRKLEAVRINAVYPDKWKDYSHLVLDGLDYPGCIRAVNEYELGLDTALTGCAVDPGLWDLNILQCNAFYDHQTNSVNILLGMLEGEFYDEDMSREELYGGIGTVIGHELSHAFDLSGARFDENGRLGEWWTDEDKHAFELREAALKAYYDSMVPFENGRVSGENVVNEAAADMAGVKVMLMLAKEHDHFDHDAFFRKYASIWRVVSPYERELYLLSKSDHPLNYLRVNATLQQFDEFLVTYQVGEGDGMYISPQNRVNIW